MAPHLARPHPAGVDHDSVADRAVLGVDARHRAARGPRRCRSPARRCHLDTQLARPAGQLHGRAARVDLAVARQVHRAVQVARPTSAGTGAAPRRGRSCPRRGRWPAPCRPGAARKRSWSGLEATRTLPTSCQCCGRARLGLQAAIEPDAVLPHAHDGRRGVEVGDHPGRVPGGAAGQLALVERAHVGPAAGGQVVGDAAAGDAAADDDDARLVSHPWRATPSSSRHAAKAATTARMSAGVSVPMFDTRKA